MMNPSTPKTMLLFAEPEALKFIELLSGAEVLSGPGVLLLVHPFCV